MPNSIVEKRFPEYKKSLDHYGSVYSGINIDKDELKMIHRQIKRFDIRFRLSMGLEINFNNKYSRTRNRLTNDTYIMIYKTNDLWFLYEVFKSLSKKFNIINYRSNVYINNFNRNILGKTNINLYIESFNAKMYKYFNNERRSDDFIKFLESLERNSNTDIVEPLINKFKKRELFKIIDIQNIIYRNRNNFVHTDSLGMTALTGVNNYRTKIKILEFSYEALINILFECTIHILNVQKEKLLKEVSLS
jgi:hypothetical protein